MAEGGVQIKVSFRLNFKSFHALLNKCISHIRGSQLKYTCFNCGGVCQPCEPRTVG